MYMVINFASCFEYLLIFSLLSFSPYYRFNISPVAPPFVQYIGTSKNSSEHHQPHTHTYNNGNTKSKSPHSTSHHHPPASLLSSPTELEESDDDDDEDDSDDDDEDDELDYDSDDSEPDHLNRDLSATDHFSDYWSPHDLAIHGDSQNVLVSYLSSLPPPLSPSLPSLPLL
jgi:hypothetical protein